MHCKIVLILQIISKTTYFIAMDLTFEQLEEQIGGNEDMVRLVRVLKGKFNFLCSSLEEKDQKIMIL